jgi:hypothetical protein
LVEPVTLFCANAEGNGLQKIESKIKIHFSLT